jgi:sugar-specific transcriptional regulator TrmB
MSQKKVLKTLVNLGLTEWDARVYCYIAKKGPIKAREAVKALQISKQRLYPILKKLRGMGIVNSTIEHPARFTVVKFEKVVDSFLKAKMEQVRLIRQNKDEILSDWKSIAITEEGSSSNKFTVIEGRFNVYSKIQQMIQDTRESLSFVATVPSLARADQFGLFDSAFSHPLKSQIRFRFLTELSKRNTNAIKSLLKKKPKTNFNIEGKTPNLGLKLLPRMIIKDNTEAVFFIDPRGKFSSEQDNVCLWTNCTSLVNGFLVMFEDLWHNSTSIEKKIIEIETGKPIAKIHIISDTITAQNKYHEVLLGAKKEIIICTSGKGLIDYWKHNQFVKTWVERRISVKFMAPITSENVEVALQLLKLFEVRHVPEGYLGTTIVDGKHLFQFKNLSIEQDKDVSKAYFTQTFYTNDVEYIENNLNMLDDIWTNAFSPSAITLESISRIKSSQVLSGPEMTKETKKINGVDYVRDEKIPIKLTEKTLLSKFINAKRSPVNDLSKDPVIYFGKAGQALIHPPESFNLPDMLFHLMHFDKMSSYGTEDTMIILCRQETPNGHLYIPGSFVTDNPKALVYWKTFFKGYPFKQNLVNENKFHVQVQHNILFAGWTVPIQLSPFNQILPPSCIMVEGYGKVKTAKYSVGNPSGYVNTNEVNYFDAFVTFIHPSSKYSGPGTDGYFFREFFSTTYPPSSN